MDRGNSDAVAIPGAYAELPVSASAGHHHARAKDEAGGYQPRRRALTSAQQLSITTSVLHRHYFKNPRYPLRPPGKSGGGLEAYHRHSIFIKGDVKIRCFAMAGVINKIQTIDEIQSTELIVAAEPDAIKPDIF